MVLDVETTVDLSAAVVTYIVRTIDEEAVRSLFNLTFIFDTSVFAVVVNSCHNHTTEAAAFSVKSTAGVICATLAEFAIIG